MTHNITNKDTFTIIAGPCAVESLEQMVVIANKLKELGVNILRGGAFKPRTSPFSFQGLQHEGLEILSLVRKEYNLKVITELIDKSLIPEVVDCCDIVQIGSRNMQNYSLLKAVGSIKKPILLKRGYAATITEWLMAAQYIKEYGNKNVILCERGIRTFDTTLRNTLDLGSVVHIKKISEDKIFVDPSHACGNRNYVIPLALAALAAGADGIMVEVHPNPNEALSDGEQSLSLSEFELLVSKLTFFAQHIGREII